MKTEMGNISGKLDALTASRKDNGKFSRLTNVPRLKRKLKTCKLRFSSKVKSRSSSVVLTYTFLFKKTFTSKLYNIVSIIMYITMRL